MHTIKFSDDYDKLPMKWEGTQAILIGIMYCPDIRGLKKRLPQLINYDTSYRGKYGRYELNFSEGIILSLFHINSCIPFTTIRRYTKDKYDYYNKCLGETFILERIDKQMQNTDRNN
jgi:hypothetical protein